MPRRPRRRQSGAAAEASALGTSLRRVYAFSWPLSAVPRVRWEADPAAEQIAARTIQHAVDIARSCESVLTIEGSRVPGFLLPVLIEESRHADLLVIGSRGVGGSLGTMVCSTAFDLAAGAYCPIVVTRPYCPRVAGTRVVVGYDGSPASAVALDLGMSYAERHGAVLRVVSVQPPHRNDWRIDLATAVQRCQGKHHAELVQADGHAAGELLRLSTDAQMIFLGSRGCGGFTGMHVGSVSQTVLAQADCPVAVIPPAAIHQRPADLVRMNRPAATDLRSSVPAGQGIRL